MGVCLHGYRRCLRAIYYVMRHESKIEREGQSRIKLYSHEEKDGSALDRGDSEVSTSRWGTEKRLSLWIDW